MHADLHRDSSIITRDGIYIRQPPRMSFITIKIKLLSLACILVIGRCQAFTPFAPQHLRHGRSVVGTTLDNSRSILQISCRANAFFKLQSSKLGESESSDDDVMGRNSRRRLLFGALATTLSVATTNLSSLPVSAADPAQSTIWLTGKTPKVPGQKPKDKNDTRGTRKDSGFLRSISDCKNQCENSGAGPDGFAKSKEECLSECQDICCTTYEQCTFAIVPRI